MAGYGMQGHAMFAFQDSFNTLNVDSLQAISITEESIIFGKEQITEAGMYSRFAESPYHEGLNTVEGDITQEASPHGLGYFLKSALRLTSTTSDTGTQTHVFESTAADFDELSASDPLTIEVYRDVGSAALYYNLNGNTLALNVANGELLTATLGVLGGGFSRQTASSPTFPTPAPFKWDQSSIYFDGANVLDIQDLTININNNLENRFTLQSSATPRKIKRTAQQIIELTGTFIFQQHSYWDAFLDQDEKSLVMHWAAAQAPNALTIDIPLLRFKSFDPVMAGPGIVEASFTAGAMFSTSSNTAIEITLVNTVTAY
jgi:hypothetical protein